MWTVLVWLRIRTGGEVLWIWYWTFGSYKMLRNYRVSQQLGISRVVLISMESVICLNASKFHHHSAISSTANIHRASAIVSCSSRRLFQSHWFLSRYPFWSPKSMTSLGSMYRQFAKITSEMGITSKEVMKDTPSSYLSLSYCFLFFLRSDSDVIIRDQE
jgi:hypothetical protein